MSDSGFSNRLGRQYGLVHQDDVADLNILVIGDSHILPYLLLNLAFCGVGSLQGGVYLAGADETVRERHLSHQFLLSREDEGKPLVESLSSRLRRLCPDFDLQEWPRHGPANLIPDVTVLLPRPGIRLPTTPVLLKCTLCGQIAPSGIYIGHEALVDEEFEEATLTASLASLGGAILAQEILRLTNTIRTPQITTQEIQIAMRLRSKDIGLYLRRPESQRWSDDHGIKARLRLGGETLPVRFVGPTNEPNEGAFAISLPAETLLSRIILDSIELIEEPLQKQGGIRPPLVFSLFGEDRIENGRFVHDSTSPIPLQAEDISAVVLGVGGLGAWVTAILAATPSAHCRLSLVDSDTRIEEHNLNRQILYNASDIGRPKVFAAMDALQEIRPDIDVRLHPLELGPGMIRYVKHGVRFDYRPPDGAPSSQPAPGVDEESARLGMLSADLQDSRVVLSCLDNMQSRWVLNGIAWILGKPFINGGVGGFVGTADYIDARSGDACMVRRYGEGIKTDTGKVQCGGAVPILAIVTTNAVIASLQATLAICASLNLRPASNRFYYNGTSRDLWVDSIQADGAPDPLGMEALLEELEA